MTAAIHSLTLDIVKTVPGRTILGTFYSGLLELYRLTPDLSQVVLRRIDWSWALQAQSA